MSLAIITLLVLLTLYAIYFYDKCYNNSKKHLSLQQYLKQESANNGTNETSQSFSDQEPMLRQIKENGALIFEEHKLRGILDGKYYWELRTNKYKKKGVHRTDHKRFKRSVWSSQNRCLPWSPQQRRA